MTVNEILDEIKKLNEEEQAEILSNFCRSCYKFIGNETDWSGSNYCYICSSDPIE